VKDIVAALQEIATAEEIQVDEDALLFIARQSTGALRDAISLLDQLASTGGLITLAVAQNVLGTAASQSILDLFDALHHEDAAAGLDCLHSALDSGSDPRQYARQVVDYLRNLLLIRMSDGSVDATTEMRAQMERHAGQFETQELLDFVRIFNQAANEARAAWQPSLPLEMAFIQAVGPALGAGGDEPHTGSPAGQIGQAGAGRTKRQGSPLVTDPSVAPVDVPVEAPADTVSDSEIQGQLTLKAVNTNWKRIVSLVEGQNKQVAALLRSGRVLGMKDGVLYFGITSEVLKSKMDKSENLEIVQQVLLRVLDKEVPVRCVVATGKNNALPPDIDSDGMVASALRDLGGEIVDVQ
jgi:DNA polymerase-3 subunit gamma/tau